jgi:hypothetical protein
MASFDPVVQGTWRIEENEFLAGTNDHLKRQRTEEDGL